MPKTLTVWTTTNSGKFRKSWEYLREMCTQVRKQQLELNMEQQTGSKSGREYVKAIYCYPAYLTYMQSTSWETLGWMNSKLVSRLLGEISVTSDMQMMPLMAESEEELKSILMKVKEESENVGWKLNIQRTRSWSYHFMVNRLGNSGNIGWLYFFWLQNHCRWWLQPWN